MKTILFLLSIFLFSCSKDDCEQCTRTWHYRSYTAVGTTVVSSVVEYDGGTEVFYACGEEMIEAEEKGRTTYSKTLVTGYNNKWNVIEGTGTCNCN